MHPSRLIAVLSVAAVLFLVYAITGSALALAGAALITIVVGVAAIVAASDYVDRRDRRPGFRSHRR